MWTTTHFPAAMRSLNTSTRLKAIEIANQLLEQGQLDPQRIITISVLEARRWARNSRVEVEASASPVSGQSLRPFA
jgi:uncharacterized protein YdaT